MNKQEAIKFLNEQIDGIEVAINKGKIFADESDLRKRQDKFRSIIDLLQPQPIK